MLDRCSERRAFSIGSAGLGLRSTRIWVAPFFGRSPRRIEPIDALLAGHLVQRPGALTLHRLRGIRESMIRLFLCRFVAPPSHVPGGSSASSSECPALQRPVLANTLASLRLRAPRDAIPTTTVAWSADHEFLAAARAISLVALHQNGALACDFLDPAARSVDPRDVGAARDLCAVREPIEGPELTSPCPQPMRRPRSSPVDGQLRSFFARDPGSCR